MTNCECPKGYSHLAYCPYSAVDEANERLAEAQRLILQLPCRCINLGDGEYVECDRCTWLHSASEAAPTEGGA